MSERSPRLPKLGRPFALLQLVLALSWLVPLLLLAMAAWLTWSQEIAKLDARITGSLSIIAGETEKVFEIQDLTLKWLDERIRGMSWDEIEHSAELHRYLTSLTAESKYADAFLLADGEGSVRAFSNAFPLQQRVSISDRAFFAAAQRSAGGLAIERPSLGRLSGRTALRLGRARSSSAGFDGIVSLTFSPNYFTAFFASITDAESTDLVSLLSTDGSVLVGDASGSTVAAQALDDLAFGDVDRLFSFRSPADKVWRRGGLKKIGDYPLMVAYAVDLEKVRDEWLEHLAAYSVAAIISSLLLFALSVAALRLSKREQDAIKAWQGETEQRQRAEAQVRQTMKSEALVRMARGIAHHFNNLLPAMSGLLELTHDEVPRESPTARRLERMIAATAAGRRLVQQILTFSRNEIIAREPVEVAALIEDTLALIEPSLARSIHVVRRLECRGTVVADRPRLQEAIMNLIVNAAQALEEKGGTLTLATEEVVVAGAAAGRLAVAPGAYIRVICRDDGVGILPEHIDHVFDPFFTTKPAGQGTGLGLALVHGVVTAIGGAVYVESVAGEGSAFALYLPRALQAEGERGTRTEAAPAGSDTCA